MIEILNHAVLRVEPGTRPDRTQHRIEPLAIRESARVTCIDGVYELLLFSTRPKAAQIREFLEGEAEFGLVVEEPAIGLCFRFGEAIPWSFAPLEWRCRPRADEAQVSAWESRALLRASLNEPGGLPAPASRNITLSLDLTRALNDAVRDRDRISFDPHAEQRALTTLHRRCPSPRSLLSRSQARSIGGP